MSLPPLHPALVHLPIAFILLSVMADLGARLTRRDSLRHVGLWSLLTAFATGVPTIAAGYWDLNRATLDASTRDYVQIHMFVGWAIFISLALLVVWRWRIRQQARRVVTRPYTFAAIGMLALTLFQGWFGGEIVYSHGAGVAAAGQGTEMAQKAQQRLARIRNLLEPAATAVGAPGPTTTAEEGEGK